jgi:hypothetical protein
VDFLKKYLESCLFYKMVDNLPENREWQIENQDVQKNLRFIDQRPAMLGFSIVQPTFFGIGFLLPPSH